MEGRGTHGRGNFWACSLLVQVPAAQSLPTFQWVPSGPLRGSSSGPWCIPGPSCQQDCHRHIGPFWWGSCGEGRCIIQRMSRDGFDHLWPLHLRPCGIYGDNLRPPPFCCPFLSSLPSTSGHILPGSLQPSPHVRRQPSDLYAQKTPRVLSTFPGRPFSMNWCSWDLLPALTPMDTPHLRFHVLSLPRVERKDWHLHDTRSGAVATGLKIVNHISVGDFPGDVGEAASGWGVNPFYTGTRITVMQEWRQAPEGQEHLLGKGDWESFDSFVCWFLINIPSLVFGLVSSFGLYLSLQGTKP